jgi:hypothetical protein
VFIHSLTVKLRVIGIVLAGFMAYLLAMLNPLTIQGSAAIWVLDGVLLGVMGIGFYLWHLAPQVSSAELPDSSKWKEPNRVPRKTRMANAVLAAALITYGSYGLYIDDIFVPGKGGEGLHFSGIGAWLIYASILCATANLISVVVDHYDKRNNEIYYAHVAAATQWLGWLSFIAGILLALYQG